MLKPSRLGFLYAVFAQCHARRRFPGWLDKLNSIRLFHAGNYKWASAPGQHEEKQTHFGFDRVSDKEKAEKGIHRLWKDRLIQVLHPCPGTRLLDVAGGTGDIAFRFINFLRLLESPTSPSLFENPFDTDRSSLSPEEISDTSTSKHTRSHVVVCDINGDMLEVGKKRAQQHGFTSQEISWVQGDAESLPFPDNSFDTYTIAFGIRNVVHIDQALREAFRVLRPGGRFLCLEFSTVQNPVLGRLYDFYSFEIIPVLGQIFARDWKSYQYLVESIRQFPSQDEFLSDIKAAGFCCVTYENLSFGIATIHSGFKLT